MSFRSIIPYPLAAAFHLIENDSSKSVPDLYLHLYAIDILARFMAYIHIAFYFTIETKKGSINRRIDRIFEVNSQIKYFALAKDLSDHFQKVQSPIHSQFSEFYRSFNLAQIQENEEISIRRTEQETFNYNLNNIWRFCDLRNDIAHNQILASDDLKRSICRAIRDKMSILLGMKCFTDLIVVAKSESIPSFEMPLIGPGKDYWESEQCPSDTQLYLQTKEHESSFKICLEPLIVFRDNGRINEIRFLYRQDRLKKERYYTPIGKVREIEHIETGLVKEPWATIEIHRILQQKYYKNEEGTVKLLLSNLSPNSVTLIEVNEILPKCLRLLNGKKRYIFKEPYTLEMDETFAIEYNVKGFEEGERSYNDCLTASFDYQGTLQLVRVSGDLKAKVLKLPPARINIKRYITHIDGRPLNIADPVRMDDELKVMYIFHSEGDYSENVVVEDTVFGAKFLIGNNNVYSGPIKKSFEQPDAISSEYTLLVNGNAPLTITTKIVGIESNSIADAYHDTLDAEKPIIDARLEALQCNDDNTEMVRLDGIIAISHLRGSRAYQLTLNLPNAVHYDIVKLPKSKRIISVLAPGKKEQIPFSIRFHNEVTTLVKARLSWTMASGLRDSVNIKIPLGRLVIEDVNEVPLIGRTEAQQIIAQHLVERYNLWLNVYGDVGTGKKTLINRISEFVRDQNQWRMLIIQTDCHESISFLEAISTTITMISPAAKENGPRFTH